MAEQINPAEAFIGVGIIRPFQRDKKNDYASAGGRRLVASCVGQVIGTDAQSEVSRGELPWRTDFGSWVHLLRHRKGPATVELLRAYIQDAVKRWEPRVSFTRTIPVFDGPQRLLSAKVRFDLIAENRPGNQVTLSDQEVEVSIGG